jgi:hypothetical protein
MSRLHSDLGLITGTGRHHSGVPPELVALSYQLGLVEPSEL